MLVIAGAFLVAGVAKGAIGIGLPPIAVGLMTLALPLEDALAIMTIPTLTTNIWQAIYGTGLGRLIRRFWSLAATAMVTLVIVARDARPAGLRQGHVDPGRAARGLFPAGAGRLAAARAAPCRALGQPAGRRGDRLHGGHHRHRGHPLPALHAIARDPEGRSRAGARPAVHRDHGRPHLGAVPPGRVRHRQRHRRLRRRRADFDRRLDRPEVAQCHVARDVPPRSS